MVHSVQREGTVTGAARPPRRPASLSEVVAVVSLVTTLVSIAVTVTAPLLAS